jgi:hypothetical protein
MKPSACFLALCAFAPFALMPLLCQADDLQPLGDEFGNAATFSRYQEHGSLEGWGSNHVESADINTSSPGNFRIVPRTTGWYEHLRGTHFSKNITGNFVLTAHVFVYSRQNPAGPLSPSLRLYSLGGILVRQARAITHAAPDPYTTSSVWPPQDFGSDWTPGDETWGNTSETGRGENYLFLSLGTAGNAGTRQFEIKTTRRSRSELYFSSNGVAGSNEAWLQMVRIGNTMVCLRRHSAAGPWIVENRYPNPDHAFPQFGDTLQVGLTAYTDFNSITAYEAGGPQSQFHCNYIAVDGAPDLILDVDYLRMQRPHASLTEAMLQAMSTSYNPATNQTAFTPVQLGASPAAAPYLGDNANTPLGLVSFSQETYEVTEMNSSVTLTVTRSGSSLSLPLSLQYTTQSGTATAGSDYTPTTGTLTWAANDQASKTIVVPIMTQDGVAEGPENFSLNLSQLVGPATFVASAPSINSTVHLQDAPRDQWRLTSFGTDANTPAGQITADYDLDDWNNALEYALNTPATTGAENLRPEPGLAAGKATISFQRNLAALDVTYEVRAGDDLSTWETIATKVGAGAWTFDPGVTVEDDGSGEVMVTDAQVITAGQPRFLQIRISY